MYENHIYIYYYIFNIDIHLIIHIIIIIITPIYILALVRGYAHLTGGLKRGLNLLTGVFAPTFAPTRTAAAPLVTCAAPLVMSAAPLSSHVPKSRSKSENRFEKLTAPLM